MRTSLKRFGKAFGNLATIRGTTIYSLSPMEQKTFAGAISKGVPNTLRRIRENIFLISPSFIVGYLIYNFGENAYQQSLRKQPGQFDDEE